MINNSNLTLCNSSKSRENPHSRKRSAGGRKKSVPETAGRHRVRSVLLATECASRRRHALRCRQNNETEEDSASRCTSSSVTNGIVLKRLFCWSHVCCICSNHVLLPFISYCFLLFIFFIFCIIRDIRFLADGSEMFSFLEILS